VSITNTQNYSATVDFTISNTTTLGEHPRTVYAWFKDTAENVSSPSSDSITLVVADTVAPSSASILINNDNSSTSNTVVTLALSTSDNYGVSAYYVSEISTAPSSSNSGWTSVTSSTSFSITISFTLTGESSPGSYSRTVYTWFKDSSGNISSSASDEITLIINDTTNPSNPTITANNGDSSTTNTVVTLALSATDNVGITAYYASENNSTPASNASGWDSVTSSANYSDNVSFSLASTGSAGTFPRTVYIWFKDAAGNLSGYSSDAINLVVTDTTAPASPSISINSGADNTTSTNVTLTLSATDSEGVTGYYASESSTAPANNASGWTSLASATSYSGSVSYSLSSFGIVTLYVWYKDSAGNVSSTASDSINAVPWTKQLGTSSNDKAQGGATDSPGNVYVTGSTEGELDGNTSAGSNDIFLVKYNPSGTKQWTKQLGTSSSEMGLGLSVDSSNNIYVTGYTYGGLDGITYSGYRDMFLVKYNSSGTKQWTKLSGASIDEFGNAVTADSSDNIYVTGMTGGGLDSNTHSGNDDIFLVKYNSSGAKQWTKQLGTSSSEMGLGLTVDSSNNIYVTGYTYGCLDNGNLCSSEADIFLVKYNSGGTKQWTKQLGTSSSDMGYGVTVDSSDNIYVTGETSGGLDGNTNSGGIDMFLVKYNSSGTKQWTKQLGTSLTDYGAGVTVDSLENIYVSGPTYGGLDGNTSAGSSDLFVVKYNSSGTKQWTKQLGTSSNDIATGVTADSSGNVYVTGRTEGGLDGNTSAGSEDLFVVKYNSDGVKQ
jgi:uncharacterized delta-60 repeat protein